jgi:hypothetical protein
MWAYDLVMRDIKIMERKIKEGDVGLSDASREKKLFSISLNYLTKTVSNSYGVPDQMKKDGIIPRKFFQVNTQRVTCFTNHKLGQIASLDMTIRSLCDGGYLAEVPKVECIQKYQFHGKCYRILNLPYGTEEKQEAAA